MVYLNLFLTFLLIGFTSFGGLSMIPIINSEMLRHGWMTAAEVSDIVAIAEMTPGPLGVNSATFAGMRVAGIPGALVATFGVLVPALTTTLLAAMFLKRFKDSPLMQSVLYGIRPVSLGLVAATVVTLSQANYLTEGKIQYPSLAVGAIIAFLLFKFKLSVPKLILTAAVLGLFLA